MAQAIALSLSLILKAGKIKLAIFIPLSMKAQAMSLKNSLWAMRHEMRPQQGTKPLIRLPQQCCPSPDDVYFPVLHTRSILERAEKGEKLFSANIFFGAEPDKSLKRTSTVIGTLQKIDDPKLSENA